MTPLLNLTIAQLSTAADKYAEQFDERFQKIARAAYMEGMIDAQKIDRKEVTLC